MKGKRRTGQVLARFHGDEAELARLGEEYELAIVKVLDAPSDAAARARVARLREAASRPGPRSTSA